MEKLPALKPPPLQLAVQHGHISIVKYLILQRGLEQWDPSLFAHAQKYDHDMWKCLDDIKTAAWKK